MAIISRNEAREAILKKKYYDELMRIARSKNLININSQFEKQLLSNSQSKHILGLYGKNL